MKNYLLTGGFAAMLLLSACGSEETAQEETVAEKETSEQAEAETVEEVTEEETVEETTQEPETLDEVNEELAGEEGITQIYGYNDEVVTEQIDTLNVTRNTAVIFGMTVDADMEWYFAEEGYAVGDELQVVSLEYTIENTVEDQRDFYLNQTTIITSTGEQIESEWLMQSGLQSEMLGAVQSTGEVTFLLRNGGAEDIEWIDIIIPRVSDGEWNSLTDEYKQRIEINQE